MLTWLHLGDLHASDEDGWHSLDLLEAMVDDIDRHLVGAIDFVFLPGDNANHGTPEQYRRIRAVLEKLRCPWHAIPGDHDFEPGGLADYRAGLGVGALPFAFEADGRRCLLLDIVSHGRGGPDFRLGPEQSRWLRDQLEASRRDRRRPVVFMHAFPGDLAEDAEAIALLFAEHGVVCVDTGHTHYNELLNDGRTIYTATRSTGQIEEGPPGFSLHAVDGDVVAWRFKVAAQPWPMVLITSPRDRRLVTRPLNRDHVPGGTFTVRAKVFGPGVGAVRLAIDDAAPRPMTPVDGEPATWCAEVAGLSDGDHRLQVSADNVDGQEVDGDAIVVRVANLLGPEESAPMPSPGQDVHSIGAWEQHGLLGSQLGPNKHGRKW